MRLFYIVGLMMFASCAYADTVVLTNGNTLEATVLQQDNNQVELLWEGAKVVFSKNEIVSIVSSGLDQEAIDKELSKSERQAQKRVWKKKFKEFKESMQAK